MRIAAAVVAAVTLAAGLAAVGSAQAPPPTVPVEAGATAITVGATAALGAGPTRFEVRNSSGKDAEIAVGALRPGVTVEQFTSALKGNPDEALELVHVDGGVALGASASSQAVTVRLRQGSTYVAVNLGGEDPSKWTVSAPFTTSSAANGAAEPSADARVRMVDLRFTGSRTLPRNGVVRFENAGWAPHFAVTAPLRKKATARAVRRAVLSGSERRLGRVADLEAGTEPQPLITRGAVDFQQVRFPRRGRYLMICFFEGHNAQGMYRIVRVR